MTIRERHVGAASLVLSSALHAVALLALAAAATVIAKPAPPVEIEVVSVSPRVPVVSPPPLGAGVEGRSSRAAQDIPGFPVPHGFVAARPERTVATAEGPESKPEKIQTPPAPLQRAARPPIPKAGLERVTPIPPQEAPRRETAKVSEPREERAEVQERPAEQIAPQEPEPSPEKPRLEVVIESEVAREVQPPKAAAPRGEKAERKAEEAAATAAEAPGPRDKVEDAAPVEGTLEAVLVPVPEAGDAGVALPVLEEARRAIAAAQALLAEAIIEGGESGMAKVESATRALELAERALATAGSPSSAAPPAMGPEGAGEGDDLGVGEIGGNGDTRRLVEERIRHVACLIGPPAARRAAATGIAVVRFQVNAEGYVGAVEMLHSTGTPALDKELAGILHLAEPFPYWLGWLRVAVPFELTSRGSAEAR